MRWIWVLLLVPALAVGVVLFLGGAQDESAGTSYAGAAHPGLRGGVKVLRGEGWIGQEPTGLFGAGGSDRLLVFVDPASERTAPFVRGTQSSVDDMPALRVVWLTTAPDEVSLARWLAESGARGPALYGMEQDVIQNFGGSTLPMLRLIDKRGRVVARDLIGLKAHSLTGTRRTQR